MSIEYIVTYKIMKNHALMSEFLKLELLSSFPLQDEKRRRGLILVYDQNDISAADFCFRGRYCEERAQGHKDTGGMVHHSKKTRREVDTSGTQCSTSNP